MKKKIILVFVALILILVALLTTACNKKQEEDKIDWFAQIEKPMELADEDLSIEWIVPLETRKSVAILFNGYSEYDSLQKFGIPSDVYTVDQMNTKTYDFLKDYENEEESIYNLARFWKDAGFSVGIFHYEKFADEVDNDGKILDFSNKIFDKTQNNFKYKNDDGEIITKDVNFNLLEAFIDVYNQDIISKDWDFVSDKRPFEIRFIGHKAGANLAVAAADYLYRAYDDKAVKGKYLPNRISLLNPYLSNYVDPSVNVDYKNEKLMSLLLYNKNTINTLSDKGVVFEMYQANLYHYLEYKDEYNGVIKLEEDNYQWEEGADTLLYDAIVEKVAYLEFYENITNDYFIKDEIGYEKYDKLILDWYLFSICGAVEDTSSSYKLENGEWPIFDGKNHNLFSKDSYIHYGMSAWVSTVYLKIMQGHKYTTSTYVQGTQGNPDSTNPDPMKKFGASINQTSDLRLNANRFFIAGYVYEAKDKTKYVNLGPDCALANVKLSVKIASAENNNNVWYEEVETDSNGFYFLKLPEKMITASNERFDIEFVTVSPKESGYMYFENNDFQPADSTKKIYLFYQIDVNSINKPGNITNKYALHAITSQTYYVAIIKNCALIKNSP